MITRRYDLSDLSDKAARDLSEAVVARRTTLLVRNTDTGHTSHVMGIVRESPGDGTHVLYIETDEDPA